MSLDLDIPSLLNPFDGDFRGGTDLRQSDDPNNAYRRIRDARNDARDDERQADLDGEQSSEAIRLWRNVWNEGQEYLQTCAKDLEIVAYMIEASVRLGGFGGLAQALKLTQELVDSFWGELLPTPDEDGVETTLLPIDRLNGDVITYPLMRVAITEDTSIGEFVVWQYTQAKQLESLSAEEREQRVSRGAVTMESFRRGVAESSDDFFRGLAAEISAGKTAVNALDASLKEKAGEEFAPNLSRFMTSLEESESILRIIAGNRLVEPENPAEDGDGGDGIQSSQKSSDDSVRGEISSRRSALELLEKVAVWFEQHEPQSILPSEIRKARRRAQMTPQELYVDLITDDDVRDRLFRDVGIQQTSADDADQT